MRIRSATRIELSFALSVITLLIVFQIGGTAFAEETAPAPASALRAGFARTDLTPAVGMEVPGGMHKSFSKGIHDVLFAEAAVLDNGAVKLAVVGIDLIMIPRDVAQAARNRIQQECGIPGENVLIAASHTHNGGPIVECFGSERNPEYCELAAQRIAESVIIASKNMMDAQLAVDSGEVFNVGFNRRFKMRDGTVKTHPGKMNPDIIEPDGPVDPQVGVIALADMKGNPIGCIVNHAMHGTTLGGSEISADWPYYLRKSIRGGLGADIGVVFLNGACGDVTQVNNQSPPPTEFGEKSARFVGTTVGAEVLKVLVRAKYQSEATRGAKAELLALPIRDLGANDAELLAREAPAAGLGSGVDAIYAREAALVREMKAKSPTVSEEVQALRIGDAVITTNPTEFFCALGLAIKKDSPFKLTCVSELTNGYAGYCAPAKAFAGGGYEVRTARSSFLAPEASDMIVETSRRLIQELKD